MLKTNRERTIQLELVDTSLVEETRDISKVSPKSRIETFIRHIVIRYFIASPRIENEHRVQ